MLLSFCVTGLALGKDDGDGEEDAAKAKPALPNFYLDMRTIYSTLPAGSLSIGFSTPPLLSTLANLSSLRAPTSPSSRSISVDLPLTVDVNDQLSVYGGVSGGASQAGSGPWTDFTIFSFTLGFQADIYQQNGGMFPTITVQSNVSRSIPDAPLASTTYNTILEADYALNMRREGCSRECNTPESSSIAPSPASALTSWAMSAATISGTTTGSSPAASACSPSAARSF
jgi:hypothetical protein